MREMQMTYQEIAKRLNIKLDSARKLVRRKRWKRTMGNDGNMRINVPLDGFKDDDPTDSTPDIPTDVPRTYDPEKDIKIARLEAELKGVSDLVEAERRRADAEALRTQAAERDRDAWKELATRPWWKKITG
jgi:hypothetical protein